MSNYTKTTNFATKDSLPSGDANKIVKGAEINTEFDNIATAVATKSNIASPTFTGTVTIPTADINGGAIDGTTIGGSSASAITATTLVANTSLNIASDGATVTGIKDEDDMSSNSATKLATQQSIKAYVDSQVTAQDLDVTTDSGTIAIDLDSETLTVTGGTGLSSSATGNAVTLNIDSTVATLTGSQTLTNKTLTAPTISGNLTTDGTIDGRDVATDGSKLDGIEANATADQTAAEIRTLVGSATDSNVFTDADHSKLDGIEASATADQTASEIRALVESASDSNVFTDADHSKLDGIEASADVTDATNVTAAGALMDSECTSLASVKALNQGVATTDSPSFASLTSTGQGVFKVDSTDQIKIGDASLTNFWTLRAGTNLLFKDNGTERMRIDSSGNVGIGTDSPSRILHLKNSVPAIRLEDTDVSGLYHDILGAQSTGVSIDVDAGNDASSSFFRVDIDGSEKMRLDHNNRLFVGTTNTTLYSSGTSGATGVMLDPNGPTAIARDGGTVLYLNRLTSDGVIVAFRKNGSDVGTISTNANSLPSDRNFKRNIQDLTLGLDFVESLNPVTYNFKIDDEGQAVMTGLIAQEVEEALTAAGVEKNSMTLLQHNPTENVNESDYQMDYLKFVPILINSIKEQQALIESLTTRIAELEE